ncbi:MAG: hypothetical protein WC370_09300 [Dehalococcoidales bacterium]|jgi:hypothetical protein
MRNLSSTLLLAQQKETVIPYLKISAVNKSGGVNRYDWSRLYQGSEDDYFHALAVPGNGSLVKARITPPADSNKLYVQHIASPSPESDFSQWTYTGQYNAVIVAAAALGAEVSVFWIKSNREIRRIKSMDYGVTWGSPELVDYSPTIYIYGLAAAYKPNGDLAIFFADQSVLYVKKCLGGTWQSKAAWDKSTDDLSGIGCVYGSDWNLVLTGKDAAGNYKLWSLVYGDGGDIGAGTWSVLKELASAPSGGNFLYKQPFLDKTDVYRCFFIEKYTGNEAYSRPYQTYSVPGAAFVEGLWREPAPFNLASEYGLAMAHDNSYSWLTGPGGVWRADMAAPSLELTDDVISARQEIDDTAGALAVELRNDDGRYASPGQDALAALDTGCQLDFSPGCVTSAGAEYSGGQSYCVESLEHTSGGGKASLILRTRDGWGALADWQARYQLRWNKTSDEASVKAILGMVLARVGLKLEVKSESAVINSFYPDFTVNPGEDGKSVIRKLLSFVPDVIFIEGSQAYLVNPQSADDAVYSYGVEHVIKEGKYRRGALQINRVEVEGLDSGGAMILAERFAWEEASSFPDRLLRTDDKNLNTLSEARQRGDACLRQAALAAEGGILVTPVNCGQQLYDVISVTDVPAGLSAAKKRVMGTVLVYQPQRGEYFQRLELGGV